MPTPPGAVGRTPTERGRELYPPPAPSKPWFWGRTPRPDVDDAVRTASKGDYAIRQDTDGHYSLTVNDGAGLSRYKIRVHKGGYEFAKSIFPSIDAVLLRLVSNPLTTTSGTFIPLGQAAPKPSGLNYGEPVNNVPPKGGRPTAEDRNRLLQAAKPAAPPPGKSPRTSPKTGRKAVASRNPASGAESAVDSAAAAAAAKSPTSIPSGAVQVRLMRHANYGMGIRIGETKPRGCMIKVVLNPALQSQLQVGQRLLAIGSLDVSEMTPREIGAIIRHMQSAVLVLETTEARANISNEVQLFISPIDTDKFESLDLCKVPLTAVPPDCRSRQLNRYLDILPNPATAVTLSELPMDKTSSYINANYVRGYATPDLALHAESLEPERPHHFVAAQGPLVGTVGSFIRMIWELGIKIIVQTTNFIEQNRRKCERYFPTESGDAGAVDFDGITVVLRSWKLMSGYRISILELKKGSVTRVVEHFWFVAWPDHGVPTDKHNRMYPNHVIEMLLKVRQRREQLDNCGSPLLVHCAAGVGRTGTFIAIDHVISALEQRDRVDLNDIIGMLRQDRMALVQHTIQYKFAYQACIDYAENMIAQSGNTGDIYAAVDPKRKDTYEETKKEGKTLFRLKQGSMRLRKTEHDKAVFRDEAPKAAPSPRQAAAAAAAKAKSGCDGCRLRDESGEVYCRICGKVTETDGGDEFDEFELQGTPRARLPSMRVGLEDEPWYFGTLTRSQLNDMLVEAPVGSFGVRVSSQPGCYVLTYQQEHEGSPGARRLQSILIKPITGPGGNRMYQLDQCKDKDFVTVPDLISFFKNNDVKYIDDKTGKYHRIFLDNARPPE